MCIRDSARSGWIGDYMDPFTFLSMYVIEGGENGSGWADPKFERLLSDANRQHDPDVRYKMLAEAEAMLLRAQPTMPLYNNATNFCLLYTSDAADERSSVDLG